MHEQNTLPASLEAVAALFIVFGIGSVVNMVVDAMQPRRITLDLGTLSLLVGYGLLQRKPFWRRVALAVA